MALFEDQKPLDWDKVYDSIMEKSDKVAVGVSSKDLDWFLRDSNVSAEKAPLPAKAAPVPALPKKSSPSSPLQTPLSPHLHVLNTNKSNASKTQPSVSSILEEEAHSSLIQEYALTSSQNSFSRRRGSALSINSASSIDSGASSGGFFSKLKNKLQRTESANSATSALAAASHATPFKSGYSIDKSKPSAAASPMSPRENFKPMPDSSLAEKCGDDPRLCEYVRYFTRQPRRDSCLKNAPKPEPVVPTNTAVDSALQSKLSSFLRRKSSVSQVPHAAEPVKAKPAPMPRSPERDDIVLPAMKHVKPLKHVAFHSQTFLIDPPQQIPSRHPRKGNVEILPGGVVQVNPLTEADKVAIEKSLRGLGGGLVVGGTGTLGLIKKDADDVDLNESGPDEASTNSSSEPDIKIDGHARTLAIEKPSLRSTPSYKAPVKKMALDTMYTRCCHLREILPIPAILKQIPEGSTAPLPILQLRNPTPSMIEIQTFADFIRIAPIIIISLDGVSLSYEQFYVLLSAMCAKTQLEKLSLRNTPIDAQGWSLLCWFLSQNKVLNRLDITQCPPLSVNVLKKKKKRKPDEEVIERMTCNYENRSDMDWSLFTAALIARHGIEELILTGCCITDLSVFESLIKKGVCIKTVKLGLAYNQILPQQLEIVVHSWLFSKFSKGLDVGYNDFLSLKYLKVFLDFTKTENYEELVKKSQLIFLSLNATNLRFSDTFKEVFEKFVTRFPKLKYLDLSNNAKLFGNFPTASSIIAENASSDPSHSSGDEATIANEKVIITHERVIERENSSTSTTGSTASTKLAAAAPVEDSVSPETITLYFCSQLLLFKNLARLHLDNNGLSSQNLTALFETIPYCKTLVYLSIVGNKLDLYSATSLLQSLRNSTSLTTVDGDYAELPDFLKERIGLYSMRNMDHSFEQSISDETKEGNDKRDQAKSLADELNQLLARSMDGKLDKESAEVRHVIERVQHYKTVLKRAIDDLFYLQYQRELNMEGKEALIRFLYIDSSLERGLKLFNSSLVKKDDENFTSSDLINMHLAEDEKSEQKASTASKVQDAGLSEHELLSPKTTSVPMSRQQSYNNLSNLDKEEGSAMRLLRLGNKGFLEHFDSTSGEEIRKKLLNGSIADLDGIIQDIYKARDESCGMKQIFHCKNKEKDRAFLQEVRLELENLQARNTSMSGEPAPSSGSEKSELTNGDTNESGSVANSEASLLLNDAYDRILKKFDK